MRNITYEALIFDMDGVLIDSKELVEAFWREKLELYGIEIADDELELKFHGRPARLIIDDLFEDMPEHTRAEMVIPDFISVELQNGKSGLTFFPKRENRQTFFTISTDKD